MLWHLRLGHLIFKYLKHLFPKLLGNRDPSLFRCEICEFGKHHSTSFLLQPYKPSKSCTIIHNDVWGPNKITTPSNKRWSRHLHMIILHFTGRIYWKKNQRLKRFLKIFTT